MSDSLIENSYENQKNFHRNLFNKSMRKIDKYNNKEFIYPNVIKKTNKNLVLLFQVFLIVSYLSTEISCFDYCCCLFSKDPFRGYNIIKSQILSFDHSNLDKESIGYKMINQCYRTYNGFPTLENINLLKRDMYTIDQKQCDKDCNYFIREINEKYNIKQEANREIEAKKLKEIRKKFMNILTKKIKENTNSLHKGQPCRAEINTMSNWKANGSKNKKREDKGNQLKIINTPAVGNLNFNSGYIESVPTIADLSIDSDNENEQSYLQLDNPKYNLELKSEIEKKKKAEADLNMKNKFIIFEDESVKTNNKNNYNESKHLKSSLLEINNSLENLETEIKQIEVNSDLKLAELLKSNPNYLSIKTNFKPEAEVTEEDFKSEEELKKDIEKLEIQIIYLNKKNKKPIDFILDRFSIQDDVLVKIIKIFEVSLDEVIYDIKSYFEDTVYFQFKVADKYNANSKGGANNKKKN